MATPDRLEIKYATFQADVRFAGAMTGTRVVVAEGVRKVFAGHIAGVLHLIVEDPSFPQPETIPWTNVAGVSWIEAPPIDFLLAPPKLKPVAKKSAESAA